VQTAEGSQAANRDRDGARHAGHDPRIEQDPATGHPADLNEPRLVIASPAPTEPQVTNVTPASAAGVAIGDDERVPIGTLAQPAARLLVEDDGEFIHHAIMTRGAQ
jgi:hypothetical protein